MENHVVSVILPTFNRAYIIQNAISSVLGQSYSDLELIIVDDCSTDNTKEVIDSFDDKRITYIKLDTNMGGNHARNIGVRSSCSEYVAFIDSDNIWLPDCLESQMDIFKRNPQADFVFARTKIFNGENSYIFPVKEAAKLSAERDMLVSALFDNIFDTNTVVMKREVFDKTNGFNEHVRRLQDWDFFLDILLSNAFKFVFNDNIVCNNYVQHNSISQTKELFWDSRINIFCKHIDICRDFNVVTDVLIRMLTSVDMEYMTDRQLNSILSILNDDEILALYKRFYSFSQLAYKRNRIVSCQHKWLKLLMHGKTLKDELDKQGVESVAIYGYGVLGKALYEELKNEGVHICGVIDKEIKNADFKVITPSDVKTLKPDMIIVTAITAYEEIKSTYLNGVDARVTAFDVLINDLYKDL